MLFFFLLANTYNRGNTNLTDADSIPLSGRTLGEDNGNLPWYSCLGNNMERRAWWATDHGVAKEWDNLTAKQQMMGDICNFSQIHKTRFVVLIYLKFCWGIDAERLSGVFPRSRI